MQLRIHNTHPRIDEDLAAALVDVDVLAIAITVAATHGAPIAFASS
jgi:hypothetical protein